jgi:hypothetical protein
MNPERILIADAVALGRTAPYTGERVVFGWPIGQDQAIHHPLARRWIELAAAELMTLRTAAAYDRGEEADAYANAAKYCAAETAPHLRNRGHGLWQHGLRLRVPCRAPFLRDPDRSHLPGQPTADPKLYRRARSGLPRS